MAVPYTFAGATSSIPLSQLDTNFASTITLGNTAIQLGNTVTTLNNMTLANVTISSGNVTITNVTVTTANVTVGNITTLTGTSATYTNIASGNVTITGGTLNNVAIGGTTAASGAFTTLSASGAFSLTGDQVQISEGGTGQTTANAAFNALAPSQTGNSGKYLKTDGTDTSWDAIDINTADITGTLPILNGGTGQTTANAAFNALAPSQTSQSGKYLKTDGTNASWDALDISTADITGTLPIANGGTGLTALGTGVQTALGQNVTGSGGIVLATSPVLTTPNLGTPSAATLTNATGLPISTGVSGLGTNVATALAVNVGTAGAFVVNGGALGTPSSGTLTNCTGYPTSALSGSINLATQVTGTLATTNGGTGLTSFTANRVFYASSTSAIAQSANLTFDGTTLTAANFTDSSLTSGRVTYATTGGNLTDSANLTFDGTNLTLGGGTANGVAYLNGSKVLTTGSALTFDGTNFAVGGVDSYNNKIIAKGIANYRGLALYTTTASARPTISLVNENTATKASYIQDSSAGELIFGQMNYDFGGHVEGMRLTSTGLGIGTSSPIGKVDVGTTPAAPTNGYYITYSGSQVASFTANSGTGEVRIGGTNSVGTFFTTFYSNNSERIRITSAGDVGIGTSSPAYKLDVSGNAYASNWYAPNTAFTVGTVGGGVGIIGYGSTGSGGTTNTLLFQANGEKMRLDSSGNLGIGTSSPGARLELYTAGTVNLRLNGSLVGGNTVDFYNYVPAVSNDGFSIFIGGTNRLTMTNSGNVGIGTSSPAVKLQVNGSLAVGAGQNISWGGAYGAGIPTIAGSASGLDFYPSGSTAGLSMRLDSSGSLGLGVTPSAWAGTGVKAFQFQNGSLAASNTFGTMLSWNSIYDGAYKYVTSSTAGMYQFGGAHAWYVAPSGTAGNAISFTQALTLDSDGNLLLGTTSLGTTYGATAGVLKQTGGVFTERGQFSAAGSSTTTITTLANASNNQTYLLSVRQSGAASNYVMSFVTAYGASSSATRIVQDNTGGGVLDMNITVSGLALRLVLGSGFGNTTWDYVLTRLG